jgi:hypothetical protein
LKSLVERQKNLEKDQKGIRDHEEHEKGEIGRGTGRREKRLLEADTYNGAAISHI